MNASPDSANLADRLLRQHERWRRLAWPLAIIATGLAAMLAAEWRWHPSLSRVERWDSLGRWWSAGVMLTFLAAAGVWLLRRREGLRGAQRLDERLESKNRLETAAILHGDTGAMASAQRKEAAGFLASQPAARPPQRPLLALGAMAAVLVLAHLVTLLSWSRPWIYERAAAAKPSATPAAVLPQACIRWKTPASETKASPIEEVPLEAVADSTSGLRDAVLEMSVNGQPRLSVPVPADEWKAAGAHPVQTSIYLDQLEVEPFDVVAYYLRAERIDSRALPETASSVQFVQIKPFRDDVREARGGEGNAAFALITALKVAQLRLIKENFVLSHTDLGKESDEWKKENGRVGSEQAALEKKTGEAIEQLIQESLPAEIIDLLTQARPVMADAAGKIVALANQPALTPQGKALGLITEVEKFARKIAPHGGTVHGNKPNVDDPFHDKQQYELKQRFKTSAGELEMLAAAQAKVADDLAKSDASAASAPTPDSNGDKPPDPNNITGTVAERQTQISQRVGALLTGRIFNAEITGHLEQGHEQARESLRRIDADDPPAAREPAAAAARELQLAVDAMNRVGEEQAKLQLADAQHALNEAAEDARDAAHQNSEEAARQRAEEAAQQASQTAKDLLAQAKAQQDTGSGQAAERLNDLAKALGAQEMRDALEKLRAQPSDPAHAQAAAERLQQLADRAAQQRNPGAMSPEEIARLVERLERVRVNMQRLAANAPTTDKNNVVPKAVPEPTTRGNHEKISGQGQDGQPESPSSKPSQENKSGSSQSGQSPQGQNPQGQGQEQKSQGQGKGTDQEGKGQGQGQSPQGQGKGKGSSSGQATAQGGSAPGSANAQGSSSGSSTHGRGQASASPGDGTGQKSGASQEKDPDLGDTYGTAVGDLRTGPVPDGMVSNTKPNYSDHAPRAAQTRATQETKDEFARELVEEVREGAQDAAAVVPKSEALTEVRGILRDGTLETHYFDQVALFSKIDPPLLGLINSLRAEMRQVARRDHQLTDQNPDLAPPTYRPAVADYFEQLSRDYESAPPAPPEAK